MSLSTLTTGSSGAAKKLGRGQGRVCEAQFQQGLCEAAQGAQGGAQIV